VGRTRTSKEQGQVLPVIAVVVVVAAGAALLVATLGGVVIDRTRARTAADASALAGVTGGRGPAEQVARANGGTVRRYVAIDGEVEVTVRVGRAEATARAGAGAPVASELPERPSGSSGRDEGEHATVPALVAGL
jgi:hypothetical protein